MVRTIVPVGARLSSGGRDHEVSTVWNRPRLPRGSQESIHRYHQTDEGETEKHHPLHGCESAVHILPQLAETFIHLPDDVLEALVDLVDQVFEAFIDRLETSFHHLETLFHQEVLILDRFFDANDPLDQVEAPFGR